MKLFVIGDRHTIAGKATNNYVFANEDHNFWALGEKSHPHNLNVSWPLKLSMYLKAELINNPCYEDNIKIINKTSTWVEKKDQNPQDLIIIGWHEIENPVQVFNLHLNLMEKKIRHVFFNTYDNLNNRYNFNNRFLKESYVNFLVNNGYNFSSHGYFNELAHSAWAKHILKHIMKENI